MRNRIFELLKEQGKTQKELETFLGLSNGIVSQWKHGSQSYTKYLPQIAAFFYVPVSSLIDESDSDFELPETDKGKKNMLENILSLIAKAGISDFAFERALGLKQGTVSNWKRATSTSYKKHIKEISYYFGVSSDLILNGTPNDMKPHIRDNGNKSNGAIIYENIKALCKNEGFAISHIGEKLPKDLQISRAAVSQWKKGSIPKYTVIQAIANYFGVPVGELLEKHGTILNIARVSELRKLQGLTPLSIDRRMAIADKPFSAVVNGDAVYTDDEISKLADILQTTPGYIKGEIDDPRPLPKDELSVVENDNIKMIPLYNSVSAGFGACAVDLVEGYIPIVAYGDCEASDCIAINVHGDSMSPRIEDGDTVVVHKQTSVDSGSIAVVLLDGDAAMIKKVCYGEDWIELVSLNPSYQPLTFKGSEVQRIMVLGKIKEIHKRC